MKTELGSWKWHKQKHKDDLWNSFPSFLDVTIPFLKLLLGHVRNIISMEATMLSMSKNQTCSVGIKSKLRIP